MKPLKIGSIQLLPIAQLGIVLTFVLLVLAAMAKSYVLSLGLEIPQRYYIYVPILIFSGIWPLMINRGIEPNPEFETEK
ncbi:hypothetical protein KMW28_12595 [Flammeovirga yaeyamensis]|uniref:Uncharacterized protein n=1 Tax=Flammeovirga yaeyamensis TaxID=367791 RepID=A0AAX1MZ32_9BACT|nr:MULTISPECIES: hypothetical protein [Flammeovirga]ANQ48071.1 hypothetical protein MY04_0689 [Flammeovirga sp. MY04]MBB3695992.1 hypothetical protein [Flammeovirga yaeyamensis]NMF34678.1 hypothetical protein [Flammeovirga yaeyamensis]QWG00492.1 hypothetical protein KMW28_12595 [Flammeovirga yaeyamensis]